MSWLYGQAWLWYLIAFVVGLGLAWLFLVRPLQRRLVPAAAGPAGAAQAAPEQAASEQVASEQAAPAPVDPAPALPSAADSAAEPLPSVDPTTDTSEIPVQTAHSDSPTCEIPIVGDPAAPAEAAPVPDTAPAPDIATASTDATDAETPGPQDQPSLAPPFSFAVGPYPGSAQPAADGSAPGPEFTLKANADSMLFHSPDSPHFGQTDAEVWFSTAEEAEDAGFTSWTKR